jgi:hypothetical protein
MDILSYLPEALQGQDLYKEVVDILQSFRDANFLVDSDVISSIKYPGIDIPALRDKYNDIESLDVESLEIIAKEFGYGYILDVLSLLSIDFGTFLGTIAVIHYLKGTRKGIEFVLEVLGFTYLIIEWWEFTNDPRLLRYFGVTNVNIHRVDDGSLITYAELPHTYFLRVYIDASKSTPSGESIELISGEIDSRLRVFLRHYVYPLLLKLEVIALFIEDDWDSSQITEDEVISTLTGISYTDERVDASQVWDIDKWDVAFWDADWKTMWGYVQEEFVDVLNPV